MRTDIAKRYFTLFVLLFMLPALVLYTALDVNAETDISIPVKVSFIGTSLPSETFTVELSGAALESPLSESIELSNAAKSGSLTFRLGELPAGSYEYTLRQIAGSHDGITYDSTEYSYYVKVSDDGRVEQRAVNKSDTSDKPDSVEFTNSYRGSGKDEVIGDPPVRIKKVITGKSPKKTSEFTFVMKDAGNTAGLEKNPLPDGYGEGPVEVQVTGEAEVEIGNITFTEEGVYSYKLSEKDTKIEGYNYDDAVFDIIYTVSRDQSGKLICEREMLKNRNQKVELCEFENYYGGKTTSRIWRAVKTGDPSFMVPLTLFIVSLVALVAFLLTTGKRRKDGRG